jgi:hypothetical protein
MRQTADDEKNSFLIKAFEKETAIFIAAERDLYRLRSRVSG